MNWRSTFVQMALIVLLIWGTNLLISWGMNRYFPRTEPQTSQEVKSGQQFEASQISYMRQPLKLEVDFVDTPAGLPESKIEVSGSQSAVFFSTFGGAIDQITFERQIDSKKMFFTTIAPSREREEKAFLVALDEMTPYFYQAKGQTAEQNYTVITYEAETANARVTKQYKIYKDRPLIDLDLTVEPLKQDKPVQPRIFIPAPVIAGFAKKLDVSAVIYEPSGKVGKRVLKDIINQVWAQPQIFGLQDQYFAHLLVRDTDLFAKRAYFKQGGAGKALAIFEGPEITAKKTWRLTFFCGPKEAATFELVDKRLEALLDYGFFSFIAKFLMMILNWINGYVHNYGWAIIFLTFLIHLLMFPFTRRSEMQMGKQKELDRKMKLLKQKYADDPERFRQEQTELFAKNGFMPGLIGCLPILFQMPIFFGLSAALKNAIELYQAPFIFWIKDLSASDPYYILPILIGLGLFFSMRGSAAADAKSNMTTLIFSTLIVGVSLSLSAGLNLFILVGSVARLSQTQLMKLWKRA